MGSFASLEEARGFFSQDRFAASAGVTLEALTEETAVCALVLGENHANSFGGVMGGAIFTLADFAFAVLSNHVHMHTVAQQISMNFLSAPKGGVLTASARCRKNGSRTCVINVDVTDSAGRDIAQFVGTGFKL